MDRWHEEMTAWRRDIHAHPELAFEEKRTAALVAQKLESFGLEVTRGVGETGVVATLRCGSGKRTIAIRADMDALPMNEETNLPYASKHAGRMHACGHDGHTAILLGAAKRLAETKRFDGTVHFYFQPAEEKGGRGGAQAMVEDGLFERFPTDAVFGLHNNVFLKEGEVGVRPGAAMSAADQFEIVVEGKGGHGARPQLALDPIVAASQLVLNLQTIVSRNVNPLDMAVISVTDLHSGEGAFNVIPPRATLRGTVRSYKTEVQELLERRIREVAKATASVTGCSAELRYVRGYPPLVNDPEQAEFAAQICESVVGKENVYRDVAPNVASEDFSIFLQHRPGAYLFLGGAPKDGTPMTPVHNPGYDFNDAILPIGAKIWVEMVETYLKRS
jgi:amidohydrolase